MSIQKLLETNKKNIIDSYNNGISTNKLAKQYNCNCGTIYYYLKNWKVDVRQSNKGSVGEHKDLVIKLYDEGLSTQKIADQIGAKKSSVLKFLKKNGVDTSINNTCKGKPHLTEMKEKVFEMYNSGMNTNQIAKELGYATSAVSTLLKKNNVELRDYRYKVDESFFEAVDTEEKAYVLGWMYSDGNISGDMFRIQIADLDILEKIKDILKFEGPIQDVSPPKKFPHRKIQFNMSVCRKKMVDDLAKLGVMPAKSLILQFPTEEQVPLHLLGHFLRGVFDGDGSISRTASNGFNVSMVGTLEFVEKVIDITDCPNFKIYCRFPERENSTRSMASGHRETVAKFLDFIYKDATVYLQRKYDLYQEFLFKS